MYLEAPKVHGPRFTTPNPCDPISVLLLRQQLEMSWLSEQEKKHLWLENEQNQFRRTCANT